MTNPEPNKPAVLFKNSLAYSLLKVVFAAYFIFAVGITAYHMRLDYDTARMQIVERLGLIEKAFEDSLATALFDLDGAQLDSIINGLHEMQSLIGVKLEASNPDIYVPNAALGVVEGDDGTTILRWSKEGFSRETDVSAASLIAHEFVLYQPGTKIEIAHGKLYSSSGEVLATVQNSFFRIIVSALAKTSLLWLLFLWASTGRLSLPLRKFAEDVANIDPNDVETKAIRVDRSKERKDELHLLSEAFNSMQTRVADHIAEIRAEKQAAEKARAEAEEANRAKSKFLSSMSHELRTPMNAIMGFTQIMEIDKESPLDEGQLENLNEITRASNHLLDLIEGVLDLSKIEQNAIEISIGEIAAGEVIAESLQLILPLARENNIDINLAFEGQEASIKEILEDRKTLLGDRVRLRQILVNLLSNAIKYNARNGSVTVDCSSLNGMMRISVSDVGDGLSQAQIDQLFIPFNRLGKEGSNIEGSGIGLVICKSLIEEMSGQIGVKSCENEGSTFWIDVPVSKGEDASPDDDVPLVAQTPNHTLIGC